MCKFSAAAAVTAVVPVVAAAATSAASALKCEQYILCVANVIYYYYYIRKCLHICSYVHVRTHCMCERNYSRLLYAQKIYLRAFFAFHSANCINAYSYVLYIVSYVQLLSSLTYCSSRRRQMHMFLAFASSFRLERVDY